MRPGHHEDRDRELPSFRTREIQISHRLDQITPVWIPEGLDDMTVRRTLLREYSIEIGGGLGEFAGRVWRVGLMGESSKAENVLALLEDGLQAL